MTPEIAAAARLEKFFAHLALATHLKDRRKRELFAMYAFGILGDGERKSMEPIAVRACADPTRTNNVHSKLCYFLLCSYAFVVAKRASAFPPSAGRNRPHRPLSIAA